jgi:hypothetical protein
VPVGLGPRFLIEAGFLIAVAVATGLARLETVTIILVMACAWLLVAAADWALSRARGRRRGATPAEAPAASAPVPEMRQEPRTVRRVEPVQAPALPFERPEPVPSPGAEPGEPEPAPEPAVTPGPSAEPAPEPEPEAPPEPTPAETPPEQPRVAVAPAPPPPQPQPASGVVPLVPRSDAAPRTWNLWELERISRDQSGSDRVVDEERSFLLMYLREFADADGILPASFDGIVRESFGDVLHAVRT